MFDGIPVPTDIGAGGLVVLSVLLLMFGILIPRWTHVQRIADKDAQIAYLQAALDKRDAQIDKLVEGYEKVGEMLEDLVRAADKR